MMQTVVEPHDSSYSYWEFWTTSFLRYLRCCPSSASWVQKRLTRLNRHEEATEKLAGELDICKLLYAQRIGQFVSKLILNRRQRALVASFKKYKTEEPEASAAESKSSDIAAGQVYPADPESIFVDFSKKEGLTEVQRALLQELAV